MLQLPQPAKAVPEIARGPLKGFPRQKPFTCKLLDLSLRYEQLIIEWEQADNHNVGDQKSASILARMRKLAVRASYMSAESYEGAVFQIMLASSQLDGIRTGTTAEYRQEQEQLADRLLYRAMDRFDWKGRDISPRLREYLMPAHCDQKKRRARRAK